MVGVTVILVPCDGVGGKKWAGSLGWWGQDLILAKPVESKTQLTGSEAGFNKGGGE